MSTTDSMGVDDTSMAGQAEQTRPAEEMHTELVREDSPMNTESQSDLPPRSEYDNLISELAENPQNPEGWRRLLALVEDLGDLEKISTAYDSLLKHYPNTASAQIAYIKHFIHNEETFKKAEDLFQRFLKASPCVELWIFYLTYVRRTNTGQAQFDTVCKSYEFALSHVGQDKDSGEIWADYIQFLKSGEANTTWEEQQKMDSLRKVYHRAVQIPLDNVEKLWQELEAFETGLNKIVAKKFMADLSPGHMQARTVLRQLTSHLQGLYQPSQPEPYLPSLPKFDAFERGLVGKWKAYLKWEEGNPLELEDKDRPTLIQRIQSVYRKAVIRMRYYTEIWFMAYTWLNSVGKHDEALATLRAGLEANPSSFLLSFTYAEALEVKKSYSEVHDVYERLLSVLKQGLEAMERSVQAANPNANGGSNGPLVMSTGLQHNNPGNILDGVQSANASFNTQVSDEKISDSAELQKRRTEYGLVWIMYIRFGRRAEGLKSQRTIFGKARKERWTPWQVYEAAALTEFHCTDDKAVAQRIFEKGLDSFSDEIEYVIRYLGFLISINDGNNARALFERVVNNFPPDKARPLWERWARYEYQYGDLEASLKLEKRMSEVYPTDPPIKRLAQRYMYLGNDAIADRDLGFAVARKTSNPLGRTETMQSLLASSGPMGATPTRETYKRPASPEPRPAIERRSDHGPLPKRARPSSPPPPRPTDRDRDRHWENKQRRFSPGPTNWDREERGRREAPPPPRQEREEEKTQRTVSVPPILSWFIGELPTASSFDGPMFRTDDLLGLFRNTVIPSSNPRPKSPPPPPRTGGRPPPDYGPYTGPGGGSGGGGGGGGGGRRGRY